MSEPLQSSVFFLIQKFESKPRLQDSAGYLEVAAPMRASGLIGESWIYDFGKDLSYYDSLIQERIAYIAAEVGDEPVVVYGAGAHTERYLDLYRKLNLVALSDSDKRLWGTYRFGLEVIPPDAVPERVAHVIVSTRAFERAVEDDLTQRFQGRLSIYTLYAELADQERQWLQQHLQEAQQRIRESKPDILFYTPAHPAERIPLEWFDGLKGTLPSLKVVVIWWDYDEQGGDNPYLQLERESLQYADLIIENSNISRLERMRERKPPYGNHTNVSKIHFLPTPFDPATFYPAAEGEEKTFDIAVIGSSVGMRTKWIEALRQRYGERFHHIGGVYRSAQPLSIEKYADALRKTRIVINTQTYPFRSQCKGRVREVLACGCLLLEEDNPETRAAFREGDGLMFFSSMQELTQKVDYSLLDNALQDEVARRGLAWYEQHNSPRVWSGRVLDLLSHEQ
jgi:hypothetical protein